jgi:hypothetical protein
MACSLLSSAAALPLLWPGAFFFLGVAGVRRAVCAVACEAGPGGCNPHRRPARYVPGRAPDAPTGRALASCPHGRPHGLELVDVHSEESNVISAARFVRVRGLVRALKR